MSGPAQLDTGRTARGTVRAGDGVALATLECGTPGEPAVLLVPGYTGSKEDFAPILGPLADAGYYAVAIDLPGQYESAGPDDAAQYTPDRLAQVVLAAVAEVGSGAAVRLLGHSFGGLVCRAAVIAAPASFTSLVLLSSGPAELTGARRTLIELMEPVLAERGVPGVYAAMRSITPADPALTPELAAFLETRFLAGSGAMLAGMGTSLRAETDRSTELRESGVPVLVVHGEADDAWPPDVQRGMADRLGARYEVIAEAVHSAAVENPAALVRVLLDFWSAQPTSAGRPAQSSNEADAARPSGQ